MGHIILKKFFLFESQIKNEYFFSISMSQIYLLETHLHTDTQNKNFFFFINLKFILNW